MCVLKRPLSQLRTAGKRRPSYIQRLHRPTDRTRFSRGDTGSEMKMPKVTHRRAPQSGRKRRGEKLSPLNARKMSNWAEPSPRSDDSPLGDTEQQSRKRRPVVGEVQTENGFLTITNEIIARHVQPCAWNVLSRIRTHHTNAENGQITAGRGASTTHLAG